MQISKYLFVLDFIHVKLQHYAFLSRNVLLLVNNKQMTEPMKNLFILQLVIITTSQLIQIMRTLHCTLILLLLMNNNQITEPMKQLFMLQLLIMKTWQLIQITRTLHCTLILMFLMNSNQMTKHKPQELVHAGIGARGNEQTAHTDSLYTAFNFDTYNEQLGDSNSEQLVVSNMNLAAVLFWAKEITGTWN